MRVHVEIYRDAKREWRWRAQADNNKIVADSGEGYTTKAGARRAWDDFYEAVGGHSVFSQSAHESSLTVRHVVVKVLPVRRRP